MNRADVFRTVREATCGFVGNTPKVNCNDQEEFDDYDDYEDEDDEFEQYEDFDGQNVTLARSVWSVRDLVSGNPCNGSLRIDHFNRATKGGVTTLTLKRPRYRRLRRLQDREVFNTRVDGNCCWKINADFKFKGKPQLLLLGTNGYPQVQPKSAKRISCQ